VVLKPLTALPFAVVDHLWLIGTVACSAAFLAIGVGELPSTPRLPWYRPLLVAAGLWSVPVVLTARIGQINAYLALAVLADFVAARRHWRWAGLLTGLAAAAKLTPAIAVLALLACGYRRAAGRAVATAVAATALAAAVSFHDSVQYWTGALLETERVGSFSNGFNNSLRRLLPLPAAVQVAVWLLLVAALVWVACTRGRRAAQADNPMAALVIAMCCGYAVSPITWGHHLFFLVLAVPLLAGDGRRAGRVYAALALALLVFELHDPGQNVDRSALRVFVLPLLVATLPVEA
jgi:alpha-1,2-mannosyltransferase